MKLPLIFSKYSAIAAMHHTFDSMWSGELFGESDIKFQIFSICCRLLSQCSQVPFCMLTLFYCHLFNCPLMICMSWICCESYFSKLMPGVWVAQLLFLLSVYNHTKSLHVACSTRRLKPASVVTLWLTFEQKWSLYKLSAIFLTHFRCSLGLSLLMDDKSITI